MDLGMSCGLREARCTLVKSFAHLMFSNLKTIVVEFVVAFTAEVRIIVEATVVEITARLVVVKIKNRLEVLVELTATEAVFARQYHRIRLSV